MKAIFMILLLVPLFAVATTNNSEADSAFDLGDNPTGYYLG